MAVSLSAVARTVLPAFAYQRLAASDIARRLVRGSFWSVLGSGLSRLLLLISMIAVARVLGKEDFGQFGLIQATLGVAGLMAGLGLGATATRFVAQYAAADPSRAGRIIAMIHLSSACMLLIVSALLVQGSSFIASNVLKAPHLQGALAWGDLLMVTQVLRGIQSGVLSAIERFDVIAKLNLLEGVLSLIAMVALARELGVKGAVLGLALGALTTWIAGRKILARVLKTRGVFVTYRGCWHDWRILHRYSLPSLLANLVATPVLWFCMTWIAQRPNGFAELGLYNAAYQWHGPVMFLPMILMSVSIPILVQEWESGRSRRFRAVTMSISGIMLLCALPPVILFCMLSPWLMSFYGPGFREGWPLMALLLAAAPLNGLAKIASGALLGMNRAWQVLWVNLLWGSTLVTLTSSLIPTFGATGLAMGFLAACALQAATAYILVFIGFVLNRKTPSPTRLLQGEEI